MPQAPKSGREIEDARIRNGPPYMSKLRSWLAGKLRFSDD